MTTEARMTLALESWLSAPDHHLLQIDDPHYPSLLREISRPPPVLFVCGNPDVLTLPQLAIVGSRNATAEGAETARSFAAHLAGTGFCITSGLAEGIDADDIVTSEGDATLVVDPVSLDLVRGSAVDFVESLGGKSFQVTNPNAASGCGCGSSFSV